MNIHFFIKFTLNLLISLFIFSIAFPQDKDDTKKEDEKQKIYIRPRDAIVAKINDKIITAGELLDELEPIFNHIMLGPGSITEKEKKIEEIWYKALKKKAKDVLLIDAAERAGVKIPEREVDAELDKEIKKFGSVAELINVLKQQGKTIDSYKEIIRQELMKNEFVKIKFGMKANPIIPPMPVDLYVRPKEVREYFEKNIDEFTQKEAVKIKQIFISYATVTEKDETKRLAHSLFRQILSGTPIELLSDLYSDIKTGESGVSDWRIRDSFDPPICEIAFSMKEKEVSQPIETDNGFAIIELVEKRPAIIPNFENETIQEEIRKAIHNEKISKAQDVLLQELIRTNKIWPENLFD